MRTKLVQTCKTSANRINLNRTAMRVALIGLFISLGIGNAWGSKTYYSTMNVAVTSGQTGYGTVYVNAAGTTSQTKNSSSTDSSVSHSYNIYATANAGYKFTSWSGSGITFGSSTTANTTGSISTSSTSSPGTSKTATASFEVIKVTAAPADVTINATDPSATYPDAAGVVVGFTTSSSNAKGDFTTGGSGDSRWTISAWPTHASATSTTFNYKFVGNGSYGTNNRTFTKTVTLKGLNDATVKTCTLTAKYPNPRVIGGDDQEIYTNFLAADATQADVTKTAVFDVVYADNANNFTAAFSGATGGGAWTVTDITVDQANQKATVTYTFNGNKSVGTHTAVLTLTAANCQGWDDTSAAGSGSASLTVTAYNETEATNDASVTTTANVTTEYATFAQALAAANGLTGSTLTLLRNVDLGTITTTNNITKAMTIDLNGKELRAAVNKDKVGILNINAAVAVTIKDSKTGGKIINEHALNAQLRTITVTKGSLTLESGTLAVNNTGQYASAANADLGVAKYASCTARVIQQEAGTTVNINGGKVEAYGTRSVYGIVQASSAATNKAGTSVLNISGGEIYAEGPYAIYGIYAYGKVNFSKGTITSHINTNMVDARYAADAKQNTYNGYGYGIYMSASANAAAASCYYGTLEMTGGTVSVTNDRTLNGNYPNYGVYLYAVAANVSSATAVAADGKSRGQIASAKASIDGGEISVISGTQYSYGVYAMGGYNSYDNTYHTVQLKNCKITSKAYVCAYGVGAYATINTTNGAGYAGDVELTNCDIYAESLNTTTAAAVWVYATSATIFKDGTTTNAATWGGEFAVAGKAVINSGKYEAKTKTTTAMAVGTSTRAKTTYDPETTVQANRKPGGNVEAYPTLIIHGGTFKATSTTTTARGVSNGGYCTIDGGTFEAFATTTTAQGLYCLTGKITASGVTISASATGTAYGALADVGIPTGNTAQTGFAYAGEIELNNCDITATTRTSTEARGVVVNATNKVHNWTQFKADSTSNKWATTTYNAYKSVFPCTIEGRDSVGIAIAAKATINGCDIKATAATTTAYGIYAMGSHDVMLDSIATPELTVRNTKMVVKTNGTTTANGIYTQGETLVDGCDITVEPKTTTGYGIQALAPNNKKVTVSNTKITVTTYNSDNTASAAAYGIYGQVDINATHGLDRHGNLVLNEGNEVNVTTTSGTTAYAVFLNATKRAITTTGGAYRPGDYANAATAIINGGKYTAHANNTTGYAIGVTDPQAQGEAKAAPTCIVNGGKFKGTAGTTPFADLHANGEKGYFVLNGGYYVKDQNIDKKLGEGMNKVAVKEGTPEYTEGYRWRVTDNMTGEIVCKVYEGTTVRQSYQSLEEAFAYVNLPENSSKTLVIVMCANYTLSSGDYELPANKTLLVPYKSSGTGKGATQAVGTSPVWVDFDTKYEAPTPLYKLTMASGVNITVKGSATIEASCVVYVTNGSNGASLLTQGTGIPHGKYGWIYMEEGSHIDLESGATLISWGFITGKGEINAKNGSSVYEDFQMGDWRGGTYESAVNGNKNGLNNKGVFPVTHYYYQNIECPITYRAGSTAYALGGTAVNASIFGTQQAITEPAVQFIGTSGSMFLLDPATAGADTWVRKEYDPETDYVNWTLNSGARIGSITLKMSAMGININLESSNYVLPITTNFNIIANYGDVEISNDVAFLPGSKLTIKKEANVTIPAGKNVFFYDQDDWKSYGGYYFYPGYSPSWDLNPRGVYDKTKVKMPDADVLIEGLLTINGNVYTTAGGGNVHSTRANSGKVKFNASAAASTAAVANFTQDESHNTTLCQWVASNVSSDGKVHYEGKALNSVWLKNEDGFSRTGSDGANTPSGKTWIYMEDDDHVYRWILSYDDGCFTYKNSGSGDHQLIHPSDWVAVEANANGDHAYHSEAGNRMFVNAEAASTSASCVWWEVNPTPEVIDAVTYYVANNDYFDNYGTYYYWDNSVSYWKPKKVTVIWNDKDGNKITNGTFGDEYDFNTSPVFRGTNPTWANTTTEKHDWIGWRDAEGNIYDKNATLPRATSNVTYTAYFNTTKYQYTITFKNDDNSDLWAGLVDAGTTGAELQALFETKYNEKTGSTIPLKASSVDKVYTYSSWNTSLETVTAAATYTANYTWVTRKYHVTFYNYDAASVLYEADVDYNTRPVYNGVTPFRANTSVYSYEWTGWQQGATHYGTTADLALVTGDVYYVATFEQTELKYQVFFKRQDGSIIDAPFFSFEEMPAAFPANPTLASTVSTDYTFREWSPATLVPVTEDGKVYTALFDESPRKYTAHFVNYNGTSLNADQTIDYNTVPAYTGATPMKPNDSRNSFEFIGWAWSAGDGWEAGSIGAGEAFPAIKGDITFTAQYNPVLLQFDVIYQREDGFVILRDKKKWGESSAFPTTYAGATSGLNYQDETYDYTFDHWSPEEVVNPVTTDATYTAYYNRSIKTYSFSSIAATPAGYGTVSHASLASIPGGSTVTVNGNKITVNGTDITATPAAATAQYTYTFDHWNNVPATVTGNVTNIEAVFTRMVNQYEVTFNMKGHGAAISSQTKDYGSKVDQPADPSEAGYTFGGWYKEDACTNAWNFASDIVEGATTLYAKWTVNSYTITFDSDGGSAVASITQNYGTAVTPPANPTRTGYTFAGWLPEVPATMPVDGANCVAQWTINSYQVKFVDEDGTTNLGSYPQTLDYGAVVTAPEEPAKAADATNVYTFAGWSDGVSTYASADIPAVSGAVTYTATYNSAPTVASVTVSGATTYYATLQAAFDYAANKTTPTIKVLADIALAAKVTYTNTSKTTVTIDLNGHTVSGALNPLLTLTSASSTGGLIVIKSSVEGGQIRNVVSSNAARACVVLSKGKLRFESGKIYMENKSTSSSVQAYGIQLGSSRTFTMIDGTVEVKSTKHAYAIYSYGTTNIEGGELIVTETKNGYAAGVHVVNGTATISENPTITVSGTKYVNGVRVGGLTPAINSGKTAVTMYNGVANIEGGTYTVTASSNTAYGVYCYGNTFKVDYATNATLAGNYANGGTANVRGGVFEVTSGGATAYGVCLQTPATIQTALDADGNATYDAATTQPKANITGGKFNVSGTSEAGAVNTAAANADLIVEGGWYNINTNLDGYTAPTKSCNYHVLDLTGEDPYMYEVAEAYQLAWNLGGGTVTTAGTQAPVDATGTPSGYVAKGATLTAPVVEKTGYTFDGWNTSGGTAAATMPAENTTYTAIWVAAIADRELDIVDWTSNSITINVTNLKADGGTNKNNWAIRVNDTDYPRKTTTFNADRTLTVTDLSLTPNENLLIQLKNDADVIESQHNYMIPQIYTANATLSGTTSSSVVYVYGGKLTISGNTTLAALYVCPGAEVEVTDGNTLTVGKLVLRTKPWATAAISGSVDAANTYYTRIAPDGSVAYPTGQYYQFGLPYACAVSAVRLSDGTTPAYNTTWILKSYDEESRATYGANGENWDALAADATIEAGRGYEMFSSYKYYREYYFPVTPTKNTSVAVTRHGEDKNNSGWNIVCSPLMNVYENPSDPVDGLKVSWLLADGSYDQAWPEVIWPALPFSYQASATGYLDFSTNEFNQTVSSAPRRAAYKEDIQTEWIHLDVKDGNGVGDHTSVFVHPDRFEATYETGIDVAKQSLTASRAILYSSHAYGDMAFAGVADSLLEKGVALTVYSPKEQELTISMRNNNRLNRLAAVWLIDYEKGMTTDLLWNDYTFDAVSGTMSGRFIIQGAFFAPGVTTDLDNIQGDNIQNTKARKVIIDQKMYIQINGRLYDANGKLLKTEH